MPLHPPTTPTTLLSLPTELHLQLIPHLPYPDALSLKHTSPYFYALVPTGVKLKVSWLLDRKTRDLPCPTKMCVLKTDAAFCGSAGGEVRKLMERRRRHEECDGEEECEVVRGRKCWGRRKGKEWDERRRRRRKNRSMEGEGARSGDWAWAWGRRCWAWVTTWLGTWEVVQGFATVAALFVALLWALRG